MVDGTCHAGLESKACKSFFAALADTVLSPQGRLREQAAKWAEGNAGTERATTIGGIRLEANLNPNGMQATPGV
ncbi:hypothetical protein K1W54_09295 [Micromonospora sp. CPCC 205371]|nr:hypothetical protein [Micromonospora sp. CPCC 205371]